LVLTILARDSCRLSVACRGRGGGRWDPAGPSGWDTSSSPWYPS